MLYTVMLINLFFLYFEVPSGEKDKEISFLKDMIDHFEPVRFYKKFQKESDTREDIESHLLDTLSLFCRNAGDSRQARRLIGRFDDMVKSKACEDYWNDSEAKVAR